MKDIYIVLIIALVIITIIIVYVFIIEPIVMKKKIISKLEEIAKKHDLTLQIINSKKEDYILENNKYKLYLKAVNVPSNSLITANSKKTWNLQWGITSPGKPYPNQRYLTELVPFLSTNYDEIDNKKVIKVVIFYKTYINVMRYLNESEIAICDVANEIWKAKAIRFIDLDNRFVELL